MEKIKQITAKVIPMLKANIDTDQIVPARFLKRTNSDGFGAFLFYDWRFDDAGNPKTDFVLNQVKEKSEILLAGPNFGSGSSREHAAWALHDYGLRVIISPRFADIFKNNALNNGLLPVEVSEAFFQVICEEVSLDAETKIKVDLEKQEVRLVISGEYECFSINAHKKECLLQGYDDLDYLIGLRDRITEFEIERS